MSSISRKLGLLFVLCSAALSQNPINIDTGVKGSRWPAFGTDSGAANAYVVTTVAPLGPGLRTGSKIIFFAIHANSGASTLNVDSVGVKSIKKSVSTALATGDILLNGLVEVVYDGTNFQCLSCGGTSGGGSGTVTSIATTTPISGGTITTTGTISCPTCAIGPGASTTNHLAKFSGTDGLTLADGGAIPTGTVTSIATTSPITGGTITGTGTVACATCAIGPGLSTANHLAKFSGTDGVTLADGGSIPTGTVSSVGLTVNSGSSSGVFTVTGSPVTSSGTLDVATSGTSGGVPYFSSSSVLSSSAALTNHALVLGGGAGATPAALGSLGTTTTVLHGNAAANPSFGAVSLTADVSGILPIANGGTNTASPGLVAGSNVSISGSWPNQTVTATSGATGTGIGSPYDIPFQGTGIFRKIGTQNLNNSQVYQNSMSSPIFVNFPSSSGTANTLFSDTNNVPSTTLWSDSDTVNAQNHGYLFVPAGTNYMSNGSAVQASANFYGSFYSLPSLSSSGDIVGSRALTTVYQNTSGNLMFVVVISNSTGISGLLKGISDSSATPTAVKWQVQTEGGGTTGLIFPVLNNDYYEVTYGGGTMVHWWEYQVNVAASISANLTGSRTVNTAFQNTGSKSLLVFASWTNSGTGSSNCKSGIDSSHISFIIDGRSSATSNRDTSMLCIIPPGWYYQMTRDSGTPTLTFWYEITLG